MAAAEASLLTIILLGIVEGLTEFVPVSSTGHLVLAGELLGFEGDAAGSFEIVIQLGAIMAVIVLYWRRFAGVVTGLSRFDPHALSFARNVMLGFLPSMVIGFFVYDYVKAMLDRPEIVATALIAGGIVMLGVERLVPVPRWRSVESLSWRTALRIGVIQCLSMIPGVSRSGATIIGALSLGVERRTAAEYSFFLAVPTMLAASTYDLIKSGGTFNEGAWMAIAIGFGVSFVVALVVIRWFIGIVSRMGFAPFAWYRIAIGVLALAWLAMR
jgi:undecaprenyl-diphosphatase